MSNRQHSFAAPGSARSAAQPRQPRNRRWLPTVLAIALATISASGVAAQPLFIQTPGPNFVQRNPAALLAVDYDGDGRPDILSTGGAPDAIQQFTKLKNAGKGSFDFGSSSASTPIAVNTITSLIVGDFNGDGKMDYIRGYSDRGPESGVPLYDIAGRIAASSEALVAADFNLDGNLDFASVGSTGLSVQTNRGKGFFWESFAAPIGPVSKYVIAIDANGDRRPDLAISTSAGLIVMLNDGVRKFVQVPGSPFAGVGVGSGNLAAGDFNGDGNVDLASAGPSGVTVMLGDGKGKFTLAPSGPFATNLDNTDAPTAVADFNGDGLPDLAVGSFVTYNVTLLLNDGAANFSKTITVPTTSPSKLLAVADFNGDGLPDIATLNKYWEPTRPLYGNVSVLLMNDIAAIRSNPRSVTFYSRAGQASPAAIPVAVTSVTAGLSYTVTSNEAWLTPSAGSGLTGSTAGVTLRPAALQADKPMAAGAYKTQVRLTKPDGFGSLVNVTMNVANPSGTLRALASAAVGESPTAVAQGDFNGDGKPDLAVTSWTGGSVTILLGNGAGGYTASSTRPAGLHPSSVAAGDFNSDGRLDVAVTNLDDNHVRVLLGDGSGDLPLALEPVAAGCGPASVAVGDFNGDGKPDLAVQEGALSGSLTPIVLIGDGMGHFARRTGTACAQPSQTGRASVAVGDFNGDGNQDLASVSFAGRNLVVMLGDGAGNFTATPDPFQVSNRGVLVVEDFNGDGKQDVAVGGVTGDVVLLLGNGTGGFQPGPALPYLSAVVAQSLAVGDFDGDGMADLAVQSAEKGLTVMVGGGDGRFNPPSGSVWVDVGAASPDLPGSMAAGDFNGDGRTDLAVAVNGGNSVQLLLGNPAIAAGQLKTNAGAVVQHGSSVTLGLFLVNRESAFRAPSGTVTFYDRETPLGTIHQASNSYTFNAVNLAPGIHHLSARYAGNDRSVGFMSNTITVTVSLGTAVGSSVSSGTGPASPFVSPGMKQSEFLLSPNSKYAAAMQTDGNLVIYAEGSAIWSTQVQNRGRGPYRLALQPDGNLVIYGASDQDVSLGGFGVCTAGSSCIATWSTGVRGGIGPYTLKMQDDGNLVLYDSTERALWFTGTQR